MDKRTDVDTDELSYKMALPVRQMPMKIDNNLEAEVVHEVNVCCCCGNHGTVVMRSKFEKSGYRPDEVVRAMVDVDNSKVGVPLQKVAIKLVQVLQLTDSWSSPNHEGRITNALESGEGDNSGGG